MKKLLTAIVFSAMTLTGMGGGAAEAAPAPAAKPVVTIKAKTDTSAVKPKDDNTVIEAKKAAEASLAAKQVQPQVALPDTLYPRTKGDDYFKDAKLKNNITYAPLSNLTKEDIIYSGVVNVKRKTSQQPHSSPAPSTKETLPTNNTANSSSKETSPRTPSASSTPTT